MCPPAGRRPRLEDLGYMSWEVGPTMMQHPNGAWNVTLDSMDGTHGNRPTPSTRGNLTGTNEDRAMQALYAANIDVDVEMQWSCDSEQGEGSGRGTLTRSKRSVDEMEMVSAWEARHGRETDRWAGRRVERDGTASNRVEESAKRHDAAVEPVGGGSVGGECTDDRAPVGIHGIEHDGGQRAAFCGRVEVVIPTCRRHGQAMIWTTVVQSH